MRKDEVVVIMSELESLVIRLPVVFGESKSDDRDIELITEGHPPAEEVEIPFHLRRRVDHDVGLCLCRVVSITFVIDSTDICRCLRSGEEREHRLVGREGQPSERFQPSQSVS